MSKEMMYNGRTVAVVEVKGGWTTILDGMKQVKVRNGELSPVKAKAEKPAKAPKAEKPAKASDERTVKPDLTRYTVHDVKTASGRRAIDSADAVAAMLRGLDLADVYRTASSETGEAMAALKRRYEHLNPGMQRMNLGNLIRGARSKAAKEAAKAK